MLCWPGLCSRSRAGLEAWTRPWASLSTFPRQALGELGKPCRRWMGNTLCRAPARPVLLLLAGAAGPGRLRRSLGSRSQVPSTWPAALVAHFLSSVSLPSIGLRASKSVDNVRSQQGHIDALAHFKTKLNYKRSAAVYSSPVSDPRGLLSTSTHRKLHPGEKNLARSL